MKATPFSKRPCCPMLLSNGRDAAFVDYGGSMFSSKNGHSHFEQHQGTPTGWYKAANRWKTPSKTIQSVAASGYQVITEGEVCEPADFIQEFFPSEAILRTKIYSFGGAMLEIESFLTDDSILTEHYRFTRTPPGKRVDLALFVEKPHSGMAACGLKTEPDFEVEPAGEGLDFTYGVGEIRGFGRMGHDGKGAVEASSRGWEGSLLFRGVEAGFRITKYLTAADSTETDDYAASVEARSKKWASLGFKGLRKEHLGVWNNYFSSSGISVPDGEFEHIYNLSRYLMRASLHPDTGGLTVGMLPHLWCGGTCVPYDAWYMHQALLLTNNTEAAARHLEYYMMQHEKGKKTAREAGASGAAFSGWATCYGEHCSGTGLLKYIKNLKPMMGAYIAVIFYWHWKYTGTLPAGAEALLRDCVEFLRAFVLDKGGRAEVAPCMAGNESPVEVSNDSHTALVFARAFSGAAEVFGDEDYASVSGKLSEGLKNNCRNGVLALYPGAWYGEGLQLTAFLLNLPEGVSPVNRPEHLHEKLDKLRNFWGYDSIQPNEVYRDWPWIAGRGGVCESHLKEPEKAFGLLMHQKKYAASLGALPEKIRLDGFPIGYWYPSPHALLLWSASAALANMGPGGELRLFWGLDGSWKDVDFRGLRMPGGVLVSASAAGGRLASLRLVNESRHSLRVKIDVNPAYSPGVLPEAAELPPGGGFSWARDDVEP